MDDKSRIDQKFLTMVGTPELRLVDAAGTAAEVQRRDVRRIASTVFCSADIDPSIVDFAICRTAAHWGLTEEEVEIRVTRRLLQKTASLMNDLRWLATDAPPAADFSTPTAA